MNTQEILRRFEEISGYYLDQLKEFSMEQLLHKTDETDWSIGQMYAHLVQSALNMQLRNVELCRGATDPAVKTDGVKSEDGAAIFKLGGFPPVRIQVPPTAQYTPRQPESKEELANGLKQVEAKMKELAEVLPDIPALHTVAHPRLGCLNAAEWFELVDMHYRHHLRQLERLGAAVS